jgi:hypothetical protein
VIVTVGLAPSLYVETVTVNNEEFSSHRGFWLTPKIHRVRYQDLREVRIVVEEVPGKRGRNGYLECALHEGAQERVAIGDTLRAALPEIIENFQKHNVPLYIPRNVEN